MNYENLTTKELFDILNNMCPLGIQEDWDNSGVQLDLGKSVTKILTCLEVTSKVIDEAVRCKADLIVSHHPLFMKFQQIVSLSTDKVPDKYCIRLIEEGISLYSAHTNFDAMTSGNNDELGKILGFDQVSLMGDDAGICRMTTLKEPMKAEQVCKQVATALDLDVSKLPFTGDFDGLITKIGWCTGAGSSFLKEGRRAGVELFITGDIKYHDAQNALEMGPMLLDIGHYGSEKIFAQNMSKLITKELTEAGLSQIEVVSSTVNLDPFKFMA